MQRDSRPIANIEQRLQYLESESSRLVRELCYLHSIISAQTKELSGIKRKLDRISVPEGRVCTNDIAQVV